MAELLIKARNVDHPDPDTDRRGCYKRGDIVVVAEDGHVWGAKEGLPNFVVLKIPGVAVPVARTLQEEQDDDDNGQPDYEDGTAILAEGPVRRVFRRRRWKLAIASLPSSIRNQLTNNGVATVTKAQAKNFIRRKRDNAQHNF